jgi:predicted DNA binding protein
MAVVVELSIPATEFDLGRVTQVSGGAHIVLERVVPVGTDVMPFFWASETDFDAFERAVRREAVVESLTAVARVGDRVLYNVEWGEGVSTLTQVLEASNATILEARGNSPWEFRLRFTDHADLKCFHNRCRDANLSFRVDRIYTLEESFDTPMSLGLTPEQHAALALAVERGYFSVPRGCSLSEIASELGISQQAASERVRRAAETVLETVFLSESAAEQ